MRIFLISFVFLLTACGPLASNQSADDWYEVTVMAETGPHTFQVEIADDRAERNRGLMFRRELAEDAGMLFLFETEEPRSFWMRNTYVSLDIIYIDAEGRVVSIAAHTVPLSEASLPSRRPAIAVLEVLAGTSDRIGIQPGTQIRHPFFQQ